MMKWGTKKSSSLTTNARLIGHVIPKSWFSRFKKTSDSAKPSIKDTKVEDKKKALFQRRPLASSWTEGQFYSGVDDSKRRLSFGDERCEGQHLKSVWYDSDNEIEVNLRSPRCSRHRGLEWEVREFAGRRQISEPPPRVEILQRNYKCEAEKDGEKSKALERRVLKDVNSRNRYQRAKAAKHSELPRKLDAEVENSTKAIEKDIIEVELVKIIQAEKEHQKSAALQSTKERVRSTKNSNLRTNQERGAFGARKLEQLNTASDEEMLILGWQNLKDLKIREIMSKSEEQKTNALEGRESPRKRKKQARKVKVYTPRTASRIECKIRAVEDLKKAKMKRNKIRKQRAVKEATAFDRFAVVKSSIDPQEDFKNSMAQMITAIGIRQAHDLEELLVCYLTLNCDEYHDLIIKVFRQVWFELNHVHFDPAMYSKHCCDVNHQLSQL